MATVTVTIPYYPSLKERLARFNIPIAALAREAHMGRAQLTTALHKAPDPRLSTVLRLELALARLVIR